jgi:uncharacterized protein (DUF305 family)
VSSESRNLWPAAISLLAVLLVVGFLWAGIGGREAADAPGGASAEAGFARSMQVHHNQGVELALIVRDRTDDDHLRLLAYDMAVVQAQQSGQMYAWLELWELPQSSSDPLMAWMDVPGNSVHDHVATGDPNAPMPGLATAEQIADLQAASGIEAEVMFLELMTVHHQGAVEMAEVVLDLSSHPAVTVLAESIIASQQNEINVMRDLLEQRR